MLQTGALINQRYRVDAAIGRGGMGVIYRGHDTILDRDVAIKVVSKENLGAQAYHRLMNEAKAIARLHHPNIVAVYDAGQVDQSPFFVMELLEGESLSGNLSRSFSEVISIGAQICAALDHAHSHGIIHRDLKPGNVIMLPGGVAKLMDFGVARSSPSRVTSEGEIVGTLYYLAPEQALGGDIDHRVDLYALGVIFYEMLTGELPFDAENVLAVISQHLNQPAVPLREKNPAVPVALESLVLRLLSKKRDDRPASAMEVLQELAGIAADMGYPSLLGVTSAWGQAQVDAIRPASTPLEKESTQLPAFLKDLTQSQPATLPPFVCRDAELHWLSKALLGMISGSGGVRFVAGNSGIGKTALVTEFARQAQETCPDLIVATGRCNAITGVGDPFSPFRTILGTLTGDIESEWAAGALTRDQAIRLWNFFPVAVTALVEHGPNLIGSFVPSQALTDRIEYHHSLDTGYRYGLQTTLAKKIEIQGRGIPEQGHVLYEFTSVLQALAEARPILLILDDLHWADVSSVSLLFYLGRRIERSRILIVGTYRPLDLVSDRELKSRPLLDVLSEFKRDLGDIWVYLESGDPKAARDFVDAVLDVHPNRLDEDFRRQLATLTGGHPLFTTELIKDLQERGDLITKDGLWVKGPHISWDILPAKAEGVIEKRIERLDQSLREALAVASVEGVMFTAEVIARVTRQDEHETIQMLSGELVKRHHLLIEGHSRQIGSSRLSPFQFRHNMIQRYLYHNLGEARRLYLHEAVGTELEKIYGQATGEIALQLAHHFQQVGNAEKAVQYLYQAGVRALELNSPREAVVHLSKGLDQLKDNPRTLGWTEGPARKQLRGERLSPELLLQAGFERRLGEAYFGLGELRHSRLHLKNLTLIMGQPIPGSQPRLYAGLVRQAARQALHLVRLLPLHRRSIASRPESIELVQAYTLLCEIYYLSNRTLPLLYALIKTLNLAERLEPTSELCRSYAGMGNVAGLIPIHSLADRYFKRARQVAETIGHPYDRAYVQLSSGLYYCGVGNFQKALDDLENALEGFKRSGDLRRVGDTLTSLAVLLGLQGNLQRCQELFNELLSISISRENELFTAWAIVGLAELSLRNGEVEPAVEKLEEARRLLKANIDRSEEVRAAGLLAKACLMSGQLEKALKAADIGYQLIVRSMPPTVFSMVAGYAGVAEVYIRLYEMQAEAPEALAVSASDLQRRANAACKAFRRFSRLFWVGYPSMWLWRGAYEWQTGSRSKALKYWENGLAAADQFGMPYEKGLLHYEIARHLPPESAGRSSHIQEAGAIFTALGASYDLAQLHNLSGPTRTAPLSNADLDSARH